MSYIMIKKFIRSVTDIYYDCKKFNYTGVSKITPKYGVGQPTSNNYCCKKIYMIDMIGVGYTH